MTKPISYGVREGRVDFWARLVSLAVTVFRVQRGYYLDNLLDAVFEKVHAVLHGGERDPHIR